MRWSERPRSRFLAMRPWSHGAASIKVLDFTAGGYIRMKPDSLMLHKGVEPKGGADCASIWLLDDDLSMLKALGRLLSSADLIAEKFSDPVAFLARLKHATCRVAILDVWMPQMNGLEVQARLRRDSPKTRIIFMSGRDDPSVRQTATDAG